jgi:hypothetical protein
MQVSASVARWEAASWRSSGSKCRSWKACGVRGPRKLLCVAVQDQSKIYDEVEVKIWVCNVAVCFPYERTVKVFLPSITPKTMR